MSYFLRTIYFATAALICAQAPGHARPTMEMPAQPTLPAQVPDLLDARPALAPIAFVKFCLNHDEQCHSDETDQRIHLTDEVWKQIAAVNAVVNRRIEPDASKGGFDWSLDTTFGNCNDYAVQKRQALIDLAFPMSALSLTTAITPSGVGHLVLTLRTDRGDFILDNLRAAVVAWNRTGYRIVKRQSAANPQEWVSVETLDSTVPVASARAQDGWLQASEPAMAPFSRAYVSLPGSMAASSATTYGTLIGVPFAMGRETIALLNVARTTPLQL